jgi:D-serine deaminase-like pyridoxal phosphate-dependent protein
MQVTELETPALVVDLDVLDANLREMAHYCASHGINLRPHIKTHKVPAVAKMQIRAGACGITVAKLGEAEVMAREGLEDILIAYPIIGSAKLERLVSLSKRVRITVATDSLEVAEGITRAAQAGGARIRLLAEFDPGMHRCGVQTPADLVALAQGMSRLPGAEFAGFLFFPGHVRVPPEEQIPILENIDAQLREAQDKLYRSGIGLQVVSGGSTPTALRSHVMKTVTEIRPGTYVYNDMNTVRLGTTDLSHCALTVHVTVVSRAVKGRAVIDGGSKTFSSDPCRGGEGGGFGYCLEYPEVVLEAMSEEHGHVNLASSASTPAIGERLRFIPNHVCTAVNMHNEVWATRKGEVVERWPVAARGLVR